MKFSKNKLINKQLQREKGTWLSSEAVNLCLLSAGFSPPGLHIELVRTSCRSLTGASEQKTGTVRDRKPSHPREVDILRELFKMLI